MNGKPFGEAFGLPSPGRNIAALRAGLACRHLVIPAIVVCALLPIGPSQANWLTDVFKGKDKKAAAHAAAAKHAVAKHEKETRHAAAPKPHQAVAAHVKLAALGPLNHSPVKGASSACEPAKFRIALDVGHTAESEGAT